MSHDHMVGFFCFTCFSGLLFRFQVGKISVGCFWRGEIGDMFRVHLAFVARLPVGPNLIVFC